MNGYECIVESIGIFEKQLALRFNGLKTFPLSSLSQDQTPLIRTVSELAAKSGYSVWHFTRLFSFVTGQNPKSYITGRILSECACCLVGETNDTLTLTMIALAAYFPDVSIFSQQFRRHFGVSPRSFQKRRTLDSLAGKLTARFVPDMHINMARAVEPDIRRQELGAGVPGFFSEIVKRPPLHITGLPFFLDKKLISFDKMWAMFNKRQLLIAERIQPEQFCQYTASLSDETNNASDDMAMLVLCAVATNSAAIQKPVFTSRVIPGGTFLHVLHTGSMETIRETYRAIYCSFFAQTTSIPAYNWEYQLYNSDGSTSIYIPLT